MNSQEIRIQFAKLSGRYDLINSNNTDNGADFFLNAGQRWLDRKINHKKSRARYFEEVAAGTWYVKMQTLRVAEEVWINDSEERWELDRKAWNWLHNEFPDLISSTDRDDPLYWSPAELRGEEITDIDAQGSFFNYALAYDDNEEYSAIIILPPPDVSMVVEVVGRFWTPTLTGETMETYWSIQHPDILLTAALYKLESFMRNTAGAKDYLFALGEDVIDLDKDEIQQDIWEVDQLEG